ncbi:MAG TPA: phosphoribosylformylglycinamidine synthase subunit PurS [Candidatus Gastranaerophilaceae bacterium]|nr:phosphoribosylformylglycinamidine synthase subunit PurS [Candidatus Gastranaerophilaceae bacterium]HPT41652.1 phosphoribosylformylglycinamidine synthase subunit PurS [Candidatus Gastranaerophilaceae bacterium]
MKKFCGKIIVKMKPDVKDIKGEALKQAVKSVVELHDLQCAVGNWYQISFCAKNQVEALKFIDKIAQDILSNEVIETYEIKSLEEIDE